MIVPGIEGPAPMMMTTTAMSERLMTSIRFVRSDRRADRKTKVAATSAMTTSTNR